MAQFPSFLWEWDPTGATEHLALVDAVTMMTLGISLIREMPRVICHQAVGVY